MPEKVISEQQKTEIVSMIKREGGKKVIDVAKPGFLSQYRDTGVYETIDGTPVVIYNRETETQTPNGTKRPGVENVIFADEADIESFASFGVFDEPTPETTAK